MIGKDFSNWIKDRIEKYEFVENHDFEVFAKLILLARLSKQDLVFAHVGRNLLLSFQEIGFLVCSQHVYFDNVVTFQCCIPPIMIFSV